MKKAFLLFVFTYLFSQISNAQYIYTAVGGGIGDGDLATKAKLGTPTNLIFDADKNLIFCDNNNHKVRKIDLTTGIISTVAGSGAYDYSGDGGKADTAKISSPSGLAIDKAGNIYLGCDNQVRKINRATGIITTVAGNGDNVYGGDGGPALAAGFDNVYDVAIDPEGNLFIATIGDNRIRKVNLTTGIVSTYAGTGESGHDGNNGPATLAKLNTPQSLWFDSLGNLYFGSDYYVRKITKSTGIITTVFGNGGYNYNGENLSPTNAAIGNANGISADTLGNFYIAGSSGRIRIWNTITNKVNTYAGTNNYNFNGDGLLATQTNLGNAWGVLSDKAGTVYLSDGGTRIRKVNNASKITNTIAGNGTSWYFGDGKPATQAGLGAPVGIAKDYQGNLYFSDSAYHCVRKVNKLTGIVTIVAGIGIPKDSGDNGPGINAAIHTPMGIAIDSSGILYIASRGCHCIKKVDLVTNIITTYAGNKTAGYTGDNGPAIAAQLNRPFDVAIDKSGNLIIADYFNAAVRKVNKATGIITTYAGGTYGISSGDNGPATDAQMAGPNVVEFDSTGNLYIADIGNGNIRKVNLAGVITTAIPSSGSFEPAGIAFDRQGNYYISNAYYGTITRVDAKTGAQTKLAGNNSFSQYNGDGILASKATLNIPMGLFVDNNNTLFIADSKSRRIRKIDIVNSSPSTGMNTLSDELEKTLIYPNPSNGHFTVNLTKNSEFNKLEIYDLNGRLVNCVNMIDKPEYGFELDNGIYLIKLSGENGFETHRVVVNH